MLSYFMDCVNVTGRLLGHQLTTSAVIITTLNISLVSISSNNHHHKYIYGFNCQLSGARGAAGEHKKGEDIL